MKNKFLTGLFISAALFANIFSSGAPASASDDSLPVMIKKVQKSVVLITTYDDKNEQIAFGSGFFTGKTCEVVTNYHVMQGASSAEVKLFDEKIFPVSGVVAEDLENDVMRIRIDMPDTLSNSLQMIEGTCEVGEKVVVIGNPMGLTQTVSDGIVAAVRNDKDNGNVIQITAPISSGSSGSPVMNMKGDVIGIAVSAMIEGQNLNFAVPGAIVSRLSSSKPPRPLLEWKKNNSGESRKNYCEGLGHLWLSDYPKALELFNKAYAIDAADTNTIFYIGYCDSMLENYEDAISAYEKAIEIDPHDAATLLVLGEAYYNADRNDDAIKAIKKSIQYSEKDYPEAHYDLGLIFNDMKDQEAAMAEHKKLKKLDEKMAGELLKEIKKTK